MSAKMQFQYFSSIEGKVVQRYGTRTYIGVTRVPGGWEWDEDKVVPIPIAEINRYKREYLNAIRQNSLKQRSEKDHAKYLKSIEPPTPPVEKAEKKSKKGAIE